MFATLKKLITETVQHAGKHQISLHGAAIAFYAIFSAAPLIIIIFFALSLFVGQQQTSQLVTNYIAQLINPEVAHSLIDLAHSPQKKAAGIIASAIAATILLFGATTMIAQLKRSLNHIWDITQSEQRAIKRYLGDRLLALATIICATALFLASLLLEGTLNFFGDIFFPYIPHFLVSLIQLGSSLFSIFISILFFVLIFKMLPDTHLQWSDLWVGACVTTLLFLVGKYLVGFYLANISLQSSYETAGSFVILMVWIYYNAQVVLIGAEFTRSYLKHMDKSLHAPKYND